MADVHKSAGWEIAADCETYAAAPPDCQVIFYNDDCTTVDFVVTVLMSVYHKPENEAVRLTELVHHSGSAVVGVYPYDIAMTRADLTVKRARASGFPLRVEVEQL
ncbi:MAG: ATP-dependent Clp protease adaptor ClpS [Treponema sp.]|nr:ATP-dependent Clp protease adaptor ClpS [Treponema sp.]